MCHMTEMCQFLEMTPAQGGCFDTGDFDQRAIIVPALACAGQRVRGTSGLSAMPGSRRFQLAAGDDFGVITDVVTGIGLVMVVAVAQETPRNQQNSVEKAGRRQASPSVPPCVNWCRRLLTGVSVRRASGRGDTRTSATLRVPIEPDVAAHVLTSSTPHRSTSSGWWDPNPPPPAPKAEKCCCQPVSSCVSPCRNV